MRKPLLIGVMLVMLGTVYTLEAQPSQAPPIKRTPLQKFDVPGTNYETVIGIAEIAPNVTVGRHTHPGPESGYLLEGEFTLLVEGQPRSRSRPATPTRFRPARFTTRARPTRGRR